MCCHTERETADHLCHLPRSQYVTLKKSLLALLPRYQGPSRVEAWLQIPRSLVSSSSSALPAISLGLTIFGQIFAYVTVLSLLFLVQPQR